MEERMVNNSDIQTEIKLQSDFHAACRQEAEWWRQKSHCKWLKDGDKNTGFFHKQALARKNFSSMLEIWSHDRVINNFDDIKSEASKHFEHLYTAQPVIENVELLNLVPNAIKNKDNDALKQVITLEEIKKAVDSMEDDRAPGPDGFNANFIKICWDVIKIDLLKIVSKSQRCSKIGGSTNSAFLALIPKEKGVKSFDRFWLISLSNIGYKIITKIMANRLKYILPYLISENQGGFVQDLG